VSITYPPSFDPIECPLDCEHTVDDTDHQKCECESGGSIFDVGD